MIDCICDFSSPFVCAVTDCALSVFELFSDIFFSLEFVVALSVAPLSSFSVLASTSSDSLLVAPIGAISSVFSSLLCSISEAPIHGALLLSGRIPLPGLFDGLLFVDSVTCCFLPLLLKTYLIEGFGIPSEQCQPKKNVRKKYRPKKPTHLKICIWIYKISKKKKIMLVHL
jgi:hypothetical protein